MTSGWVSVHRAITDHWLWKGEKFTKGQAWVDLLLNANHADNKTMIKGRVVHIQRGQQIRSQVTLAELWKWNPRTVKRFLLMLENDGMITLQSTELTTFITICNYSEYQDINTKSTEQNTEHSTEAVHSRVQTNNNVNNVNKKDIKEKLNFDSWPSLPNEQLLKDWLAMRRRVKASCSQSAIDTIGKQLFLAASAGFPVDQCIAEAETRSWKGFKAEWMKKDETNGRDTKRNLTAVERVEIACKRREAEVADNGQDNLPALESYGKNIRA